MWNGERKRRMNRRDFIKACAFAELSLVMPGRSLLSAALKRKQPDILLIMPDQMRGDCLSACGHPAVQTPTLDALAKEGVLFRRGYTTVTSCIPARYGLLTGLCPQTSGVVGYRTTGFLRRTLPDLLNSAGYSTVLVGRHMHQNKPCGYQEEHLGSTHVSNDAYDKFLQEKAPETGGIKNLVKSMGLTYNYWQAAPWPLDLSLHPTEWIIDRSCKVIKNASGEKPLFLTTSFYAPHPPLFPPKNFFDRNKKKKLPPSARGDWVQWDSLTPQGDRPRHRVLLQGKVLKNAQAGYYGLIEHIDSRVAAVISAFKERSRQAGRPWVIFFVCDHGEMMGDHGYFRKCEPYEGSANIPFIVSAAPELGLRKGAVIKEPVCLEDVKPTCLTLAGVKSPAPLDGVNLLPALRGREESIRSVLHFEHSPCYSRAQAYQALTDGKFKYIWRSFDDTEQLFDLENDPHEEHDLSQEPDFKDVATHWRSELIKRLADRSEGFVKDGSLAAVPTYPPLNQEVIRAQTTKG